MTSRMKDADLARLFENAYPNTLDTTATWVSMDPSSPGGHIIAGDMDAAWLRDNLWQIQPYAPLLPTSSSIRSLWLGILKTQGDNIRRAPYSNSFQPPPESGMPPIMEHLVDMSKDVVKPEFDRTVTFEAKYALDSLAAYLRLSRVYFQHTNDGGFLTQDYLETFKQILKVLEEQSESTFDEDGNLRSPAYSFMRPSALSMESPYNGPESPANSGTGNPAAGGTLLVKSCFRASDDACILPFWIPGNAFVAVELIRAEGYLSRKDKELAERARRMGEGIKKGIYNHAVFTHPVYGKVFAFEIDGYGGRIFMDDASPPSLLSLPYLGFCDSQDEIYVNTRKMVLSRKGNPYYIEGKLLKGQGSPHIDLKTMWPIGTVAQVFTSDDDIEIQEQLEMLKTSTGGLGLIHEGGNFQQSSR